MRLSILCGDALEQLRTLPDSAVQCCITSPPYWNLRDYGITGQLGLESTPESYISKMVEIFREVKRVLRDDGTFWVNIGDSYAGSNQGAGTKNPTAKQASNSGTTFMLTENHSSKSARIDGYKPKDLIGIPWMLAFALRNDGWYLRQDIIWSKRAPMPESVKDRCTRAHEYIFMFSKNRKYFYNADAIAEPANYDGRKDEMMKGSSKYSIGVMPNQSEHTMALRRHARWNFNQEGERIRNKRSVWTIGPAPFPEAHFATFPEELPILCILAGSKEGDVILDPFAGAGTTLLAALKLQRSAIGIELNPKYVAMMHKRIYQEIPLIYAGTEGAQEAR